MHPKDPQITGLIKNPSAIPEKDRLLMGDNEYALRKEYPYNPNNAENRREVNTAAATLGNISVKDAEELAKKGKPTEISGDAMARARTRTPAKIEGHLDRETAKDKEKKKADSARRREIDEERRRSPGGKGMANDLPTGFDKNGRKSK